ncbi:MAG: hypothetical protein ACD_28C00197G0004 [uncultured bacterium]|nr:MAG: hypothetical protein ACD_28C00197G0004 [uncultured bacterium]
MLEEKGTDLIEALTLQPGYQDKRVKNVVDEFLPELVELQRKGNHAEVLKKMEELKKRLEAIYFVDPLLLSYHAFLKNLGLNEGEVESLKKLATGYDDAVIIARKQTLNPHLPVPIPTLERVLQELMRLPAEVLHEVAKFGRPTLLMTPPNTMEEKIEAMNSYKPYKAEADHWGNYQNNVYFGGNPNSPVWGPQPTQLEISVTEGMPILPQLSPELLEQNYGEQYKRFYRDLTGRGLRMITAHEFAGLEQLSLLNYERAKNNEAHPYHDAPQEEIVDFYEEGQNKVMTAFYQPEENLTNIKIVRCGHFDSDALQLFFDSKNSSDERGYLRFRPSVEVFEF